MIKLFVPPLDSVWRLTSDWAIPGAFAERSDHDPIFLGTKKYGFDEWRKETGDNTTREAQGPDGWVAAYHAWKGKKRTERGMHAMPKGTVLIFDRYHVSHSGEDMITLRILASPHPFFHPKKLKGKMPGTGRVYFSLAELNTLPELEQVDDTDIPGR